MANEGLIIDVDYNITKAEAKQRKLNREFEISKQKAANITKEIQQTEKNIADSVARQKELEAELDRSAKKLDSYHSGEVEFTSKQFQQEIKRNQQIQSRIAKEETYRTSQEASLARQNVALDTQNAKTATLGTNIVLNTKKQNMFSVAMQKSAKSASIFGKRIFSLIRSALLFSLITKAFTKLREEFGKMITEEGTKTAQLAAQLKGNLAVIGTTLYESAKPAIEWLMSALVKITQVLTYGIAKILGKSVEKMKALTKQTKKAGEEAKKATAGFDTLQTIDTSSNSSSSESGISADFGSLNSGLSDEIALLTALASGALLVLGVILAFTGVNIPLGLGMIAIGAAGLAGAIALNSTAIIEAIRGPVGKIMAIIGSSLLLLGILLLFIPGVGWGLGLGLILAGAAALGTTVAFNWNVITDKVKSIASAIGKLFKNCWEGIKKGFKSMVNGIIGYANLWIDGLNLLLLPIRGLITGVAQAFGSDVTLKNIKIPHIPKLATGAILPGGSPMLAWVNDQPKGQPYLEGSIDNIAAAFEKYLGSNGSKQNININFTGTLSQLARVLAPEISTENVRTSIFAKG